MCYQCGLPVYVNCNCQSTCDTCSTGQCDEKIEAACVFYNLGGGQNNLIKINLPNGTDIKTILDRIDQLLGSGSLSDIFVKISANDTTSGYLTNKLQQGNNITLAVQNVGFNENILVSADNDKVSVDSNDTPDYLENQIIGGTDGVVTNTILKTAGQLKVQPSIDLDAMFDLIRTVYISQWCDLMNMCPANACPPPSALTAIFTGSNPYTANLTWVAGGAGGNQTVEYKLHSQPSWTLYSTLGAAATTESIPTLDPNLLYDFKISNDCASGVTTAYQISDAQIDCITPTITTAQDFADIEFIELGDDVDSYTIQLYDASGTTLIATQTIGQPFTNPIIATFNSLQPNTNYQIRIIPCIGTVCNSSCSYTLFTTADVPVCNPPNGLQATAISNTSVSLTWTPAVTSIGQELYYGELSGITGNPPSNGWTTFTGNTIPAGTASEVVSGLTAGTTYAFTIRNICDNNSYSTFNQTNFTTPSGENNVRIFNNYGDISTINGISPAFITTTVGAFPIEDGAHLFGLQSGISAAITVNITSPGSGSVKLYKNGVLQQCLPVSTGTANYVFTTVSFTSLDIMDIDLSSDPC